MHQAIPYIAIMATLWIGVFCGYLYAENQTYRHILGNVQEVTKIGER